MQTSKLSQRLAKQHRCCAFGLSPLLSSRSCTVPQRQPGPCSELIPVTSPAQQANRHRAINSAASAAVGHSRCSLSTVCSASSGSDASSSGAEPGSEPAAAKKGGFLDSLVKSLRDFGIGSRSMNEGGAGAKQSWHRRAVQQCAGRAQSLGQDRACLL